MPVPILEGLAYVAAIWSTFVFGVQIIGSTKVFKHCSKPLPLPLSPYSKSEQDVPHITIIRPVKDLEPRLYECLASTFKQTYPRHKLSFHLCISSRKDPAYPVLEQIAAEFSGSFDLRIFVESEDPLLQAGAHRLGPNPKIRNISRAYREAKDGLIWMIDCNVWVSQHCAGRMVDKILGLRPAGSRSTPYKFVHQLPMSVDLTPTAGGGVMRYGGGRLDEMFMGTTHAKFYSAINTVGVAPCVVGKSNMFRKSHLDAITDPAQNPILSASDASRGRGLDFFSSYICEDHLIGDLFWRTKIPGHLNHGLVFGEVALQPMSDSSVVAYWGRRVRWLRVRKWTVLAATLVEPGVESLICCASLAFAMTTIPWIHEHLGVQQTWAAMAAIWATALAGWIALDWNVYSTLRACRSISVVEPSDWNTTPDFARGTERPGGVKRRPFFPDFLLAWLGRELLALPIWTWAVLLGTTITWRGKSFSVNMDMSVDELPDRTTTSHTAGANGNAKMNGLISAGRKAHQH